MKAVCAKALRQSGGGVTKCLPKSGLPAAGSAPFLGKQTAGWGACSNLAEEKFMKNADKTIRPSGISRRDTMKFAGTLAGGGAALLASPSIMVRAAHAAGEMKAPVEHNAYRFRLGDFTVTTLLDGARPGDGPHPTFGADQPAEAVHELMRENLLPETRMINYFTPTIVDTGERVILFDTGLGAGARENGLGRLTEIMGDAGYQPENVDTVVITHFHPDHIGGLMEDGAPAFANAEYVTGETEYDFWTAEERMSGPTERVAKLTDANIVPLSEKFTFIGDGDDVAGGITAMAAFGHTPGHMIFNIESGGERLVLTADTANHFVASLQRPEWEVRFDMDKEQAAASRKKVFDMIAADRVPFIGYHMPFPAAGFIEKLDQGYRYIPNAYQLEL